MKSEINGLLTLQSTDDPNPNLDIGLNALLIPKTVGF